MRKSLIIIVLCVLSFTAGGTYMTTQSYSEREITQLKHQIEVQHILIQRYRDSIQVILKDCN